MRTKNFYRPTPVKMRKLGDGILLFASFASGGVMGLPITEHQQLWAVFIVGLLGTLGKFITNFYSDETTDDGLRKGV